MKYLEKDMTLRVSECDVNGRWRLGAMLLEMQEAAGEHSSAVGCGRETLVKMGLAWVVVRMEIQVRRYPSYGEQVRIRTFHRPSHHRFFPRFFQIWDAGGELVACASSLWLLMDLKSRQSVSADRLPQPLPDNSDMEEPLRWPGGIAPMEAPERRTAYEAVYTDLDANGHVNNTKYADWLCNVLGTEVMTHTPVRELTIHFDHEIRPDQEVELRIRQDGLRFQMCGVHEDLIAFEMSGILMDPSES